jgi:glycosyltransferase involved in cell wall biosynthesis
LRIGLLTSLARGGPVEHALVLAGELAARGHEVRALCATEELAARFAGAGAEPRVVPLRHGVDLKGAAAMRRELRGLEVLHAHDRRSALWLRLLPRPAARAVLVQTVHGLPDPYLPPPAGPERPGLRATLAYRGLDAKLAWRCDAVVTPSAAVAGVLDRSLGYPSSRLVVIPNGVELRGGAAGGGEAVGTLSVLEPVKGLDTFLDAAAALAGEHPGVPFVINGTGSEEARLRRRGRELLGDRVAFPGHVPAADALGGLRILVVSSVMENAPMSLLEAMAGGVPVVATTVGGIPELAPPGTAELVPPGDAAALAAAIGRLLDDPERAREQAARALAHVEAHLSAGAMTGRIEALYNRLMERRAR